MKPTRAQRLNHRDTLLIFAFILMAWVVIGFVLSQLIHIISNMFVAETTILSGITAAVFMTSALIGVIIHLEKNSLWLYGGESNEKPE